MLLSVGNVNVEQAAKRLDGRLLFILQQGRQEISSTRNIS